MLCKYLRQGFSYFKTRFNIFRCQNFKTLDQMYVELSRFESSLSTLDQLTFCKRMGEEMDRRVNRIVKVVNQDYPDFRMQLTYTHNFFYLKETQSMFGSEELPRTPTIEQLSNLTSKMVKNDVETYHKELIPFSKKYTFLSKSINDRFSKIEEEFSRKIFKGYKEFSISTTELIFNQTKEYKGDFKFVLVDDIQLIESLSIVAYNCAQFNKCCNKFAVASEAAVINYWKQLSPEALRRYLLCMTVSGRPAKSLEEHINKFEQTVGDEVMQLLLYMTVANIEDYSIMQSIKEKYRRPAYNYFINSVLQLVAKVIKQKNKIEIKDLHYKQGDTTNPLADLNEAETFFEGFLTRQQYVYTKEPSNINNLTMFVIQGKKFIILTQMYYNDDFKINGLTMLLRDYFSAIGQSHIKFLNWPRMLSFDKRNVKDEYIKSKFKGIDKPIKIKKRIFQ